MPLRPPFRSSRPRPPLDRSEPELPSNPRKTRPTPTRTEPIRGPWGASPENSAAPSQPPLPTTPIEQGVQSAYQVFDRYLNEGRAFAQGQSAWYQTPSKPTEPRPASNEPIPTARDRLEALAMSRRGQEWLASLFRVVSSSPPLQDLLTSFVRLAMNEGTATTFHPQDDPRYGTDGATPPTSRNASPTSTPAFEWQSFWNRGANVVPPTTTIADEIDEASTATPSGTSAAMPPSDTARGTDRRLPRRDQGRD